MADNRDRPHPHPQQLREQLRDQPLHQRYYEEGGAFRTSQKRGGGPSTGKILAVVSLLPLGGILLGLAALTLMGSLIGLAITTPLLVICSPVLLPAAIGVGLAVTGFLTSGAFALTGLSSLSWILNNIREKTMHGQEPLEFAKRKMQDAAVQFGQKTKDVGQTIQSKAQE